MKTSLAGKLLMMHKIDPKKINSRALNDIADKVPSMFFRKPDQWQEDDVCNLCAALCNAHKLSLILDPLERRLIKEQKVENDEWNAYVKIHRRAAKKFIGILSDLESTNYIPETKYTRNVKQSLIDAIEHFNILDYVDNSSVVGRPPNIAEKKLLTKLSDVLNNAGISDQKKRAIEISRILKEQNTLDIDWKAIVQRMITI